MPKSYRGRIKEITKILSSYSPCYDLSARIYNYFEASIVTQSERPGLNIKMIPPTGDMAKYNGRFFPRVENRFCTRYRSSVRIQNPNT